MNSAAAYLRILRRWMVLILAFTAISGLTAALVSYQLPKEYESTTVVLVNPKQALLPGADAGYSTGLDQLVQTYVQLINNKPVWDLMVADGVPRTAQELQKGLTVKREPTTSLIDVTVRDRDPLVALQAARDIVGAFNRSLVDLQARVQGSQATSRLDSLVPWSVPTEPPTTPVSPKIPVNVGVALLAGLVISVSIAVLLEHLDDSIKSESDVRIRLGMTLVGSIFFKKGLTHGKKAREGLALVTMTHPKEPIAEAFKAIRTGLLFNIAGDQALSSLVITSTFPGEGKTSTACNLAVALAQAGRRVILVDADFRRPNLHEVFRTGRNVGLGNLILGDSPEEDFITETGQPNLWLVCSGPTPPNPSEILGSVAFNGVVERLKERSDIVIFDTPPVGAVTDATVLAAHADGVLIVVDGSRTSVSAISHTRDTLLSVNARILGVVLNKVKSTKGGDYYYYYYGPATQPRPRPPGKRGRPSEVGPPSSARAPQRPVHQGLATASTAAPMGTPPASSRTALVTPPPVPSASPPAAATNGSVGNYRPAQPEPVAAPLVDVGEADTSTS